MTAAYEFAAKFRTVINLAVADQLQFVGFIRHGLLAAGEVDDAEPSLSERNQLVTIVAALIRATVRESFRHVEYTFSASRREYSGNSTHYF